MQASEDLLPLERLILEAVEFGTSVRPSRPAKTEDDPADGRAWGCERAVRASFLVEMATTERPPTGRRPVALKLCGARILGPLKLDGAAACCPLLFHGCYFDDIVSFHDARLQSLQMVRCHLPSFYGRLLKTQGDVALTDVIARQVNLEGANIAGELRLSGSRLSGSRAFEGAGLRVEQSVLSDRGFTTLGTMVLNGARVGGVLELSGAQLSSQDEEGALRADALHVGRDIACGDKFCANGGVFLAGAEIGGRIDFRGARLSAPGQTALWAEQANVHRGVWCTDGFEAQGQVRLIAASIDGPLNLENGRFIHENKIALDCWGLRVGAGIWGGGCTVRGAIRLEAATVHGPLDLSETNVGGVKIADNSVDLQRIHADELWLPSSPPPEGVVDLRGGTVVRLHDKWPFPPRKRRFLPQRHVAGRYRVRLRGFVYQSLGSESANVAARLDWIAHAEEKYLPHAYDVLASGLRGAGQDEDARRVEIAKQDARRPTLRPASQVASLFLEAVVGYGYRPWRAGFWLIGIVLVCWGVFQAAWPANMEARSDATNPPDFHAALYALDAVLPVVRLGQEEYWAPIGAAQWWYAFSVLAGWVLATVAIAAVTARFVRE